VSGASIVQSALSLTEAIVPIKIPAYAEELYSPFIIGQVPAQLAKPEERAAKLSQLPKSTCMHCSMLGDDDVEKLGEVLGVLDGTLVGKEDGKKLGLVLGSKLG
jgi:hypothetical protein